MEETRENRHYSLDRAIHEAVYVHAARTALHNLKHSTKEANEETQRLARQQGEIADPQRKLSGDVEAEERDLALLANRYQYAMARSQEDTHDDMSRQVSGIVLRREKQAAKDWVAGVDNGAEVLARDTELLLPVPGETLIAHFIQATQPADETSDAFAS